MTRSTRFRLYGTAGLCVAALVAPFLFAGAVGAQNDATLEAFYEDTQVLRRIFHDQNFTPIRTIDEAKQADPNDVILFFLGSSRVEDFGDLEQFVRHGGAVIIATSNVVPDHRDRNQVARLTGWSLAAPRSDGSSERKQNENLFYQGRAHCPFVLAHPQLKAPFDNLFLAPGLDQRILVHVAANEPAYLANVRHSPRGVRLASLPAQPKDETAPDGSNSFFAFAVGGEVGDGRFLVVASHRLFLNRMMLPEDTDNVEFAENCLSILAARKDGKRRTKLLFVDRGLENPDFDVKLMQFDPLEHLPELIAAGIDQFGRWLPQIQANLARAEERDDFHRGLWQILEAHDITGYDLRRWGFVILSALFAVYGLYRIGGPGRYRLDRSAPLLPVAVAAHRPVVLLTDRRQKAMVENDNLWEAARAKVRNILTLAGVSERRTRRSRATGTDARRLVATPKSAAASAALVGAWRSAPGRRLCRRRRGCASTANWRISRRR